MKIIDYLEQNKIVCPDCKQNYFSANGDVNKGKATCQHCASVYPFFDGIGQFVDTESSVDKIEIQKFWRELYHAAYKEEDNNLNKKEFKKELKELESLFITKKHLAVNEMPINDLQGKKVLEIGSGSGSHSSLFALKGARMTAIDITLERVISSSKKLGTFSDNGNYSSLQANAEKLPFASNNFDIVYSNGVLHHTHDTKKAVSEIYRVLASGGIAVIMLYSKHSYLYWINLFLLKGIFLGQIFRGKNWLGAATEWMSEDKQTVFNPITKVYSQKQLKEMFFEFNKVDIRKGGFTFDQLPFIGSFISKILSRYTGYNQSGLMVYDKPWRNDTKFELALSKLIGFDHNIKAVK